MMYLVFFTSILLTYVVCMGVKNDYLRKMLSVYYIAWHLPLALALFLPFRIPIELGYIGVTIVLLIVHSFPICNMDLLGSIKTSKIDVLSNEFEIPGYLYVLSYLGILFLFLDLYYIRGLSIFSGVEANRNIYTNTSPTVFGYLAICMTAIPFIILQSLDGCKKSLFALLKRFAPYAITSVLYLLSGNRQYMFFGLFVSVLTYAYYNKGKLVVFLWKLMLFSFLFCSVMLIYQFARQQSTSDNQYELVQHILQLDVTAGDYTDSELTLYAYVYAYFGVEFQSVSYFINDIRNVFEAPFMSLTFPILYRRISDYFGAPSLDDVFDLYKNEVYTATGMNPIFWISAISQLYLEGGLLWLFVYFAALIMLLRYLLIVFAKNNNGRVGLTILFSCLIYNIMSSFTSDPTIILALLGSILYAIILKPVKSGYVS